MSKKDHCALYLRSSKDRHEVSIDAQRRELLELAAAKQLSVVREYSDAVEAANDWARPGFRSLLLDIASAGRGWETLLVLDTSRLARDVDLAGVFRNECRRRGVRLVFAKIPESNPLAELITERIYQLIDHIHSHMSREKGLAGMAENVRQGYRAGGRPPAGYELKAIETGAVRDGAQVTKTKLTPSADAPTIARYLRGRAAGRAARSLARELGVKLAPASLVDLEWRALTYAGYTVWNQTKSRGIGAGGYEGGTKRRPRSEWIMQRDTHEPLIDEQTALQLLERLERERSTRRRGDGYLLSGILVAPGGRRWHGDQGFYRCGRRRVKAEALERQVLEAIRQHLTSEAVARQALEKARAAARPGGRQVELRSLQRRRDELERQIARVRNLLPQMKRPEALLPKLEELQEQKLAIDSQAAAIAAELEGSRVMSIITLQDVLAAFRRLVDELEVVDRDHLKGRLRGIFARIELDPSTLKCDLCYAIPGQTGVNLASPRGDRIKPGYELRRRLPLVGFRLAA